jgi:hypothetical protein
MNAVRDCVPPPKALQAALRRVTETLSAELPRPTPASPEWTDTEWRVAPAVAAMHGVSSLLYGALRWRGPPAWADFLNEQRIHTFNRHARIEALLRRIDERMREADIAAVALKGAALHAMSIYAAGERPMADVDLLVRPQDAHRVALLIASLGYFEFSTSWKERGFMPSERFVVGRLGEHSGNHVKIELHERICEMLPWRTTDISEIIFSTRARPGLNPYPSKAALLSHLLLHAAGAMAFQSLRLLHLHDLALLTATMTVADWDTFLDYGSGPRRLWWALPPMHLMLRYYSAAVPARVLAALKSDCPWFLQRVAQRRTLSDVSYSHLWIDAFPGIEWAQSVPEVLRYALSRIRPSEQLRAARQAYLKYHPRTPEDKWPALSQRRRVLGWLTSRQTRPVTMLAVRAALAHDAHPVTDAAWHPPRDGRPVAHTQTHRP